MIKKTTGVVRWFINQNNCAMKYAIDIYIFFPKGQRRNQLAGKPTYDELKKKVRALEKKLADHRTRKEEKTVHKELVKIKKTNLRTHLQFFG